MNPRNLIHCALLTLGMALLAQHAATAASHSAIDPAPRGDTWWQDRTTLLNKRAGEAGKKAPGRVHWGFDHAGMGE